MKWNFNFLLAVCSVGVLRNCFQLNQCQDLAVNTISSVFADGVLKVIIP